MRNAIAKLSTRAQIVIPREIRERLGVGLGDSATFEERDGEVVIRPLRRLEGEDPLAVFTEWSSEADERAYAEPATP